MSPKTLARTTGAFSVLLLLGGIVAQGLIANGLIVPRDAAATATNILAHPKLYAFGFTMFLVEMASDIAMRTLFYLLLRPVDRTAALLALVFGLVGPLPFLGISTFFQGYLITKSTFLPRWLGVVSIISGLSWLTYLYPPLGPAVFYPLIVVAMLGLLLTSGWLIVRGVDEQRWREQVSS